MSLDRQTTSHRLPTENKHATLPTRIPVFKVQRLHRFCATEAALHKDLFTVGYI